MHIKGSALVEHRYWWGCLFFFFSPHRSVTTPWPKSPSWKLLWGSWLSGPIMTRRLNVCRPECRRAQTAQWSITAQVPKTRTQTSDSMHHLNLNASVKCLFLSRFVRPSHGVVRAVAVMERWTGLCLKSPLHVEAPLLLVCWRRPPTGAEWLKLFGLYGVCVWVWRGV